MWMTRGSSFLTCRRLSTVVISLALVVSRPTICQSFSSSLRHVCLRQQQQHRQRRQPDHCCHRSLGTSVQWLERRKVRTLVLAGSSNTSKEENQLRRGVVQETEGVSRAGLRALRTQIDEGAPASTAIELLVNDVMVDGQELLTTEASVILQRYPPLAEAARAGELLEGLSSSTNPRAAGTESEFLLLNLETEVIAELDTPWAVAVKKWRQKALAVEKYRSTNPTANAVVYTYMTNCCLRQGMWEVAYDALTYAGLMSAGPFFVSRKELGLGNHSSEPSVVFDVDKMACYIAEKILDIDLDVWRRRGGDATAGAGTVGNNKPGVGIEERNFSQNDDSASHAAALRVQDMTLATARVALRKIRSELQESSAGSAGNEPTSLVILASATTNALHLGELLLPVRAIETLLALDFVEPVRADEELGERLAGDAGTIESLSLLPGASTPVVMSGKVLEDWLAQPDDKKVEE